MRSRLLDGETKLVVDLSIMVKPQNCRNILIGRFANGEIVQLPAAGKQTRPAIPGSASLVRRAMPGLMLSVLRADKAKESHRMANYHTQLLQIGGMEAENAVGGVTRALGLVPGVRVASVEPGRARVLAEPDCEQPIRSALADAGFVLAAAEVEG